MSEAYTYSAWSYAPNGTAAITYASTPAATFRRYLIPLKPTTDRLKVNAYNINISGTPTPGKGGEPIPTGNVRLGLYRRVGTIGLAAAVVNFELVKGSLIVQPLLFPAPVTFTTTAMHETIDTLGGQFFVCLQFENTTPSGTSQIIWTVQGETASDANVQYAYFTTTGAAGALPATINGNICTLTSDIPFAGVYWK